MDVDFSPGVVMIFSVDDIKKMSHSDRLRHFPREPQYKGLAYHEVHGAVVPLSIATPFDLATDGIGPASVIKWRRRFGLFHPEFNRELSSQYLRLVDEKNLRAANEGLRTISDRLYLSGDAGRVNLSHDDDFLVSFSAKLASLIARRLPSNDTSFSSVSSLLLDYRVFETSDSIEKFFAGFGFTPARNRLIDDRFILRSLRSTRALLMADITREMGLVCCKRQPYVSDFVVRLRKEQNSRNAASLENLLCVNAKDKSDYVDLVEMVNGSVSNPKNRHAELITRVKGLSQIAIESRHTGLFLTFTTPSRFHAYSVSGEENPAWVEAGRPGVRDAHSWLVEQFKLIRAQFAKHEIQPYGLRVAEPHHDGTPHWHLVLFIEPSKARRLRDICRSVLLSDTPDEPGARLHRFKCKTVNTRKYGPDAAIRYCLYYVSKNIQGTKGPSDEAAGSSSDMAGRVEAWKSVYRMRQFSQVGANYVTVWRQLRKLRDPLSEDAPMFSGLMAGEWLALENLRRAADSGDWAAFVRAMGGVRVRRSDQTLVAQYGIPEALSKLLDDSVSEFAESHNLARTRYGDIAKARVIGLLWQRQFGEFIERRFVPTRFKDWTIENKQKFFRGMKKVMDGHIDIFDAMILQEEYLAMADRHFQMMEEYLDKQSEYFDFVVDENLTPEFFELTPLELVSDELWPCPDGFGAAGPGDVGALDLCQ